MKSISEKKFLRGVNEMEVQEFIEGFVKNTNGKKHVCGRWSTDMLGEIERLIYSPSDVPDIHEMIAYRLKDGSVISNANQLEYVGRTFAWGHERTRYNGEDLPEQRWLVGAGAIPLPFTLFNEVPDVDVRNFSWIVKPVAEKVTEMIDNGYKQPRIPHIRHFSGACLFAIGDSVFLFDIDRKEIAENGIFNPFLTKLPKRVETVAEAYEILEPNVVKQAIRDGIEVQRQGEFFFVKHSDVCPLTPDLTKEEFQIIRYPPSRRGYGITGDRYGDSDAKPLDANSDALETSEGREFQTAALRYQEIYKRYVSQSPKEGRLGKSSTGSHGVEKFLKLGDDTFVSGKVTQARRQHGDLYLKGWYKVYPNTGTLSWTITGKID